MLTLVLRRSTPCQQMRQYLYQSLLCSNNITRYFVANLESSRKHTCTFSWAQIAREFEGNSGDSPGIADKRSSGTFSEFQGEVKSQIMDFLYALYVLTSPSAQTRKLVSLRRQFLPFLLQG